MTFEVHEGIDYVALLGKGDTTDAPTASFRNARTARKVARLLNRDEKIALVYQTGIANVFAVDSYHATDAKRRNARRLLQHAFSPCEWYAKGLEAAGCTVLTFSCNRAGDIANAPWTRGLEACPFRENARPPVNSLQQDQQS